MKKFLASSISDVFILLINVRISTIVGILISMSRTNFVLTCVEHGKGFITSGPGLDLPEVQHPMAKYLSMQSKVANIGAPIPPM